jgi:hypothetical protein
MNPIDKEILQICREIENQYKLNRTHYRHEIIDTVREFFTDFVKEVEKVFRDSDILIDSRKRYIIIDWSKKDDLQ